MDYPQYIYPVPTPSLSNLIFLPFPTKWVHNFPPSSSRFPSIFLTTTLLSPAVSHLEHQPISQVPAYLSEYIAEKVTSVPRRFFLFSCSVLLRALLITSYY